MDGYYILVGESGFESLEELLQGLGVKDFRSFPSIGRVYAVVPKEIADLISERYVVEPEPERRVWI